MCMLNAIEMHSLLEISETVNGEYSLVFFLQMKVEIHFYNMSGVCVFDHLIKSRAAMINR